MSTPTTYADPWEKDTIPADHIIGKAQYPWAQWWNGQKAFTRVHKVLGEGGWAIPVEPLYGLVEKTPWDVNILPHKDGTETDAYLAPELQFAVIGYRFAWTMRLARGTVVLPEYTEGAKGKTQLLAAVKGLEIPTPVIVTTSGMASKYLSDAVRLFRQQIVAPVTALRKQPTPMYAFWMPIKAGQVVQVGQNGKQSPIAPPVPGWSDDDLKTKDSRRKLLHRLYVGQGIIDFCASHWEEAQQWAAARPGQTQANGDQAGDDLPPAPEEDELPF